MTRKSMIGLLVTVLAVAAVGAAVFLLTRTRLPSDLRAAAPRKSVALVHLRPARLLQTKAFDQLVRQRGLDAGMQRVADLCGFNPVAQVDEALLFAMPVRDESWPEWAGILRGDLDPRALAECVKSTMQAHGRESKLKRVDVQGIPCAVSSRGDSRACAVYDGLIMGTEAAVDQSIAAMLGQAESALERPSLAEPWAQLSEEADVRAAGVIPQSTRDVLRGLVEPFLPRALSPVTRIESLSGELYAAGDALRGEARFATPSAEDSKAVAHAFELILSRLRDSAAIVLTPARTLLHKTSVESEGLRVHVSGDYPLHALGTVLDIVPVATRVLGSFTDDPGAKAGGATAPSPDAGRDANQAKKAQPKADAPGQTP